MTVRLTPRGHASVAAVDRSQAMQRLLRNELALVRSSAVAWRNGLAGLLAGLIGFSLIKGRSDIGTLASPWSAIVGGVLLVALIIGAYAANRLLRAAHGRPRSLPRAEVRSRLAADHEEAGESLTAMNRGIAAASASAILLVLAVAMTWYGPGAAAAPKLQVVVGGETLCGSVVRTTDGTLTLKTSLGERTVDLAQASGLQPVDDCGE